jgi:hypothetical protein
LCPGLGLLGDGAAASLLSLNCSWPPVCCLGGLCKFDPQPFHRVGIDVGSSCLDVVKHGGYARVACTFFTGSFLAFSSARADFNCFESYGGERSVRAEPRTIAATENLAQLQAVATPTVVRAAMSPRAMTMAKPKGHPGMANNAPYASNDCGRLRHRALETGSRYWWSLRILDAKGRRLRPAPFLVGTTPLAITFKNQSAGVPKFTDPSSSARPVSRSGFLCPDAFLTERAGPPPS